MIRIIPSRHDKLIQHLRNHPLAGMEPSRFIFRSPLSRRSPKSYQSLISPTVIMSLKLKNQGASTMPASQAEGRPSSFRSRVIHTNGFDRRNHFTKALRHLNFQACLSRKVGSLRGLPCNRLRQSRRSMPKKQGSLACLEINRFVPILIP